MFILDSKEKKTIKIIYSVPHSPEVLRKKKAFKNFVGKGENASNQHFLLFPECILTYQKQYQFLRFIDFVVCTSILSVLLSPKYIIFVW